MITDIVQLMVSIDGEYAGELGTATYRGGSFDNGAQRDVLTSMAILAGVCRQTLPPAHVNGFVDCCRNKDPSGFRIQHLAGRVFALSETCCLLHVHVMATVRYVFFWIAHVAVKHLLHEVILCSLVAGQMLSMALWLSQLTKLVQHCHPILLRISPGTSKE